MHRPTRTLYEFEPFRLDPEERTLFRDGRPVPLTPKAFDTLLVLVENRGRLLEKDDLLRRVWPGAFIEEANLANNISLLRKVLGDPGDRFIQTVPRRGYRFLAEVRPVAEPGPEGLAHLPVPTAAPGPVYPTAAPVSATPRSPVQRIALALLLVAAGALLGALARTLRPAPEPPSFHPLTFRRGALTGARFAPDGRTILYSATWEGRPTEFFSTRAEDPESRPLDLADALLLAVSRQGELALLLHPSRLGFAPRGTLARIALTGGAPRELVEQVQDADWSPDGRDLALIRWQEDEALLEYPAGKVLLRVPAPGWLSHVRLSPQGDRIALLEHRAQRFDDRGAVVIFDLTGRRLAASPIFASASGLAWDASGEEVWFTASPDDLDNALYRLDRRGEAHLAVRVAGRLELYDRAADGRLLTGLASFRDGLVAQAPGDPQPRDLSWLDGSWLRDFSADGRTILFDEEGSGGGATGAVYLRSADGSPAVRLGPGHAVALSPDGRWALVRQRFTDPPSLVLLPTGAGKPLPLRAPGIELREAGTWFPDSRRLLIAGRRGGGALQSFPFDAATGEPSPVPKPTPEGFVAQLVLPDSRRAVGTHKGDLLALLDLESGSLSPIPGARKGDRVVGRSADGRELYLVPAGENRLRVERLDLESGRRGPALQASPPEPSGILTLLPPRVSADAKSYAYTYDRLTSQLFLVRGAR